mgnify:CR=1 FL=1
MKKISLQWRLTMMLAALMTVSCLLLNLLISRSAVMRIDEVENYIMEIEPASQNSFVIDVDDSELLAQIRQAKNTFRIQSIAATVIVILLGGAFTYFLAGRALAPLRAFSSYMEKLQTENLSEQLEISKSGDEIARLTCSFNKMLNRLHQAFEVQRQFSANAAHELRTPLAVMQTKLDVLQKRKEPTLEEYKETVAMLSEQTGRLSDLVSILLEMTELQTVQKTDEIALPALVEEVLCDLTQIADSKGVKLIQENGEATIVGSDPLIYRAVYNLVENAIKYNRPNGTVTVGIKTENDSAVLYVKDTGTGIQPENWENIFAPFVREDKSRSRAMGGAGLGLALVRDIAGQHGGSVRIAQSSETGTEVVLTLPMKKQSVRIN